MLFIYRDESILCITEMHVQLPLDSSREIPYLWPLEVFSYICNIKRVTPYSGTSGGYSIGRIAVVYRNILFKLLIPEFPLHTEKVICMSWELCFYNAYCMFIKCYVSIREQQLRMGIYFERAIGLKLMFTFSKDNVLKIIVSDLYVFSCNFHIP